METFINAAVDFITNIMSNFGIISGIFLIILESILPILPLGAFIALNIIAFGDITGFIISWLSTVLGCMLAFYICRKLKYKYEKKYRKDKKVNKLRNAIDNISISNLVLIISLPFTPAFLINIIAGVSNLPRKKFIAALLIGKVSTISFWGIIGKSFIESMTDLSAIIFIVIALLIAYIVSKIVSKKMHIE